EQWQSAMTYKFVGALRGITQPSQGQTKLLLFGLGIGLVMEIIRKVLRASPRWKAFKESGTTGKVVEFVVDSMIVPSPYASSFGGFVDLATSLWFGGGGILSSSWNAIADRQKEAAKQRALTATSREHAPAGEAELPEDMSTTSLVGGGLIAG